MKKSLFIVLLCTILAPMALFAQSVEKKRSLINLRTCYQTNPLGIDENPVFSWEMQAVGYGAVQKAYQLKVAESLENLKKGVLVFDSKKRASGIAVNITYAGKQLKPSTRYYWQVSVWDERGKQIISEPAWFETALTTNDWGGAQWIGSNSSSLSKYCGKADIYYDVTINEGSHKANFVLGYRNKKNYVNVELDFTDSESPKLNINATHKGKSKNYLSQDVSEILKGKVNEKHSVKIGMISRNHYTGYNLRIWVDGKDVSTLSTAPKKNKEVNIIFENLDPTYKYSRLYGIGFMQEKGENAVFENIHIKDMKWQDILYKDPKPLHRVEGDGKVISWVPNAKIGAPMVRKNFTLNKSIKSARLYATAKGIYEMSINGQDISQDYFNPGWPDYTYRQTYNTFDVTKFLKIGKNAIGGVIGRGWYTGQWGYHTNWQNAYGIELGLMAKLVITFTDGSEQTIVTDGSWKYTDNGPILENDWQDGVDYDARREIAGWNTSEFNDSQWKSVKIGKPLKNSVVWQAYIGSPIHIDEVCTAKKMTEPLKNHYIYDMGQNMVGIPQLKIKGKKGQKITIHYAEMVYPDIIPETPVEPYTKEQYEKMKGQMYLDNYRGALSTDHYICKGSVEGETFEPKFTSHGFRYLEIVGADSPLALEDVKVLVLNSLGEVTCKYETSNENVNKLYSNIVWGQKGNFQAVPTDCPQRDERLGWTGDAQIFTRTATYNRNVQPFFNRWLYTLRDDQSSVGGYAKFVPLAGTMEGKELYDYSNSCNGWADVGIITPWEIYQQYGDKALLYKSYESMKRYMEYFEKQMKDFIMPIGGYGDWVALLGTPSDLTNTAYTALDAKIMTKIATILGKTEDAKKYQTFYDNIQTAFLKRFMGKDGYLIKPAGSPALTDSYSAAFGRGPKTTEDSILNTQTGYILPLYVGLIKDDVKHKTAAHLVDLIKNNGYHLNTGFIGTPYMNIVLSDMGYDDVAYKMFEQEEYPSWIYPLLQGATTIWERWNSYTIKDGFGPVSMNSFNHYSYGAIQDWMMAYSAGLQRDEMNPGYKHFILQPRVAGSMDYVKAEFASVYGTIKSSWKSSKTSKSHSALDYGFTYNATVPANTTATLKLPLRKSGKYEVTVGKKGVLSVKKLSNKVEIELSSGEYEFKVE